MKSPMRDTPAGFDAGRDIDEDERGRERRIGRLGDRGERRDPAERRADERWGWRFRARQRPRDGPHVVGEGVEAVVAVGRPGAVAVAAQVDRVGAPCASEHRERRAPGVAGLPAAVEQHDGRRRRDRPRRRRRAAARRRPSSWMVSIRRDRIGRLLVRRRATSTRRAASGAPRRARRLPAGERSATDQTAATSAIGELLTGRDGGAHVGHGGVEILEVALDRRRSA